MVLLKAVLSSVLVILANCQCNPEESYDGKKCYYFSGTPLTFQDADNYCRTKGYTLASVHSQFENNYLYQQAELAIGSKFPIYFIGANKMNSPDWSWTDGTPFDFYAWKNGQPGSDLCVVQQIVDGLWSTYPCTTKLDFACSGVPGGLTGTPMTNPPMTTAGPVTGGTSGAPMTQPQTQGTGAWTTGNPPQTGFTTGAAGTTGQQWMSTMSKQ